MRLQSYRFLVRRILVCALSLSTAIPSFASRAEVVLHSFNETPHGASPSSPLVADAAGNLYGTTFGFYTGSGYAPGVVFKLSPGAGGTWTETILHTFLGNNGGYPDGQFPQGNLAFDGAGNLYGVTESGGAYAGGTIFKLTPTSAGWKESIIFNFAGLATGSAPQAGLILDGAGNLYGTTTTGGSGGCIDINTDTRVGCGNVFELSRGAHGIWNEQVLYSFQGGSDGSVPVAPLLFDKAGNLYGTTLYGGGGYCRVSYPNDCGVAFKMTANGDGTWSENIIYTFSGPDGEYPESGLIFDSAGNLYGQAGIAGYSTPEVFELIPGSGGNWTEKTIYLSSQDFFGSTLTMDSSGNIYGTTGSNASCCGTVFELSPNQRGGWTANTLYQFAGGSDGATPVAGVLRDSAGNLYIPSEGGGSAPTCPTAACGAVVKLTPASGGTWTSSVLFSFPSVNDGLYPLAGLISDGSGNLYGTTSYGGTFGSGTVFKMSRSSSGRWQTSILHNFGDARGDGVLPSGNLLFDSAGNLYGTTQLGGSGTKCYGYGCGAVFKLSPASGGNWTESVIYSFNAGSTTDGISPKGGLIFDSQGNLYGTTSIGGTNGGGTVFALSPAISGGWTETVLHSFASSGDIFPSGSLIIDDKGNLYGTDQGDVFELSPINGQWQERILHTFAGGADGGFPNGSLTLDSAGNLYGTTYYGGTYSSGTIYQLSPTSSGLWTANILYSFKGVDADGRGPHAGVILDSSGNLYGTTMGGGSYTGLCSFGCGTVFKLNRSPRGWQERVLYEFTGGADGSQPIAPLLLDSMGDLYGTTNFGGAGATGVVFKIKP